MSRAALLSRWTLLFSLVMTPVARSDQAERTLSPYFFVENGNPETDRLPLLGTRVTVEVAGVIAEVTVRQTYQNLGPRPIHARYVFPASTRAAVHGLRMTIGSDVISARIEERQAARRRFAAAKKAGKNAALLEQQRPNVFTMEVANLMPGQRVDVELSYSELLVPTRGVYEFVYPTVVGPRYSRAGAEPDAPGGLRVPYTPEGQAPHSSLEISGTIGAGLPIEELACPSHAIQQDRVDPSQVRFTLDPSERRGGNRDFVLRYRLTGSRVQAGLMLYRGRDESFFLTMVQPPRRVAAEQIPPREYVFVVDVSCSMSGFPLDTAKQLLRDLIRHLRPTDRFNLLLFSGGSRLWAPRSVAATEENVEAAIAMMEQENGGGGTELAAAVKRALSLPRDQEGASRSLVIVTDGYIDAEREVFTTIREHLGDANVFAFGIGSGVNRFLIEGIARAGLGEPFVVLSPKEAEEVAGRFREYIESPVLTGVQVKFEGFEAYEVEPAAIPDLMADRPIVVHGKWRGAPRGRVIVTGIGGNGPFREALEVTKVAPRESNRALRHLWARARVTDLSDFNGQETDQEKREIVRLGLAYGLLTRYTSFVAVHEVIRNPSGEGDEAVQPLPLPAGVSNSAIGGMGVGAEPGLLLLSGLASAAALAIALRRRPPRAQA